MQGVAKVTRLPSDWGIRQTVVSAEYSLTFCIAVHEVILHRLQGRKPVARPVHFTPHLLEDGASRQRPLLGSCRAVGALEVLHGVVGVQDGKAAAARARHHQPTWGCALVAGSKGEDRLVDPVEQQRCAALRSSMHGSHGACQCHMATCGAPDSSAAYLGHGQTEGLGRCAICGSEVYGGCE